MRCRSLADSGLQIDYEGAGGAVEIGLDGDLARASFERFGFDDEGRSIGAGEFTVQTFS